MLHLYEINTESGHLNMSDALLELNNYLLMEVLIKYIYLAIKYVCG